MSTEAMLKCQSFNLNRSLLSVKLEMNVSVSQKLVLDTALMRTNVEVFFVCYIMLEKSHNFGNLLIIVISFCVISEEELLLITNIFNIVDREKIVQGATNF